MALTKLITDLIDGSLGTDWQATPKTADFTAVAGEGYFVDTTSVAITVTLPSSPSSGDEVSIVDYAGTADTNSITITSSNNINGASDDVLINYERGGVSMVYVDATQGWIAYNATNETAQALVPDVVLVDYLVVAGGASGGAHNGGGGGAGGLRTSYSNSSSLNGHTESSLSLQTATNYTVTIGPGGALATFPSQGNNGANSVFSTITSTGGGGGGQYSNPPNVQGDSDGLDGGSGGGAGDIGGTSSGAAGGAVTSPVTQGYAGGISVTGYGGGGGGGASAVGNNSSGNTGGVGGAGLEVNIIGITGNYYAGGGGGGDGDGYGGAGGTGGGGAGAGASGNGTAGTANTGGGGGGSGAGNSGTGGSGVVILRYPDAYTISETTSGGNVLSFTTDDITVPGTKITTFIAGDGTIEFI